MPLVILPPPRKRLPLLPNLLRPALNLLRALPYRLPRGILPPVNSLLRVSIRKKDGL